MSPTNQFWSWNERPIGWGLIGNPDTEEAVLLINGFGANTNHWRFNQPVRAEQAPTHVIVLLGYGSGHCWKPADRKKPVPGKGSPSTAKRVTNAAGHRITSAIPMA